MRHARLANWPAIYAGCFDTYEELPVEAVVPGLHHLPAKIGIKHADGIACFRASEGGIWHEHVRFLLPERSGKRTLSNQETRVPLGCHGTSHGKSTNPIMSSYVSIEPKIETTFLCEARVPLEAPIDSGTSPEGQRLVFVVKEGSVRGPNLNGKVMAASGADWARIRPDGSGALDVRISIETDDGAILYCEWVGLMHFDPDEASYALDFAKPDDPDGAARYYFRSAPRFETGDERYAWLNNTVCVCKSRTGDGGVIHQIFVVD